MTTLWNPADYAPAEYEVRPVRQTIAPPRSLAGTNTPRAMPGGYWLASFGGIPLTNAERVRRWRAFTAAADGGGTVFEVRLPERLYQPWPRDAMGRPDYTPGGIAVTLAADAALNATTLSLTQTAGEDLEAGHHLSLTGTRWGKRLYRVTSATDNGGGSWTVTIRPGLREAMSSGAACDFETPSFPAHVLAGADLGEGLSLLKRGVGQVVFEEDFSR